MAQVDTILEGFILDMAKKHQETTDGIITEAFGKHFGFPITQVDLSQVTFCFLPHSTIAEFVYQGEVFLYMDSSTNFKTRYNPQRKTHEVTQDVLYKEV